MKSSITYLLVILIVPTLTHARELSMEEHLRLHETAMEGRYAISQARALLSQETENIDVPEQSQETISSVPPIVYRSISYYPIPPSYYYYPAYVSRYSVPIGRQAPPRGYQLPPLMVVQDTAAYNRAKLAEIEARKAREQHEQNITDLEAISGTGITIYETIPSQETATVQEGKQLAAIIVPLPEQRPTQMKVKAGDIEAEVSLPQSVSPEQLETITEITKTVVTQHITEKDKEAHRDRLFSLSLVIIVGTTLLGILGYFAWGMFKANFKLLMGEIFGGETKDETRHS